MSWLCKIFGHKLVSVIYSYGGIFGTDYSTTLDKVICKRCSLSINDIRNIELSNKEDPLSCKKKGD